MIVTDDAKQELKETLSQRTNDPEICLRLMRTEDSPAGLGLMLDKEAEGDQIVEHEGAKVLLIGEEIADSVDELMLGVEQTDEGNKLVLVPA